MVVHPVVQMDIADANIYNMGMTDSAGYSHYVGTRGVYDRWPLAQSLKAEVDV